MAITVWPTFAAQGRPRLAFLDKNIVHEAQGGNEFSINLQPATRYRITIPYNGIVPTYTITAAGQDYNGLTEIAALKLAREALRGTFGRINVVHPLTGSQVLCRLEADDLEIEQDESSAFWRGEVSFLTEL